MMVVADIDDAFIPLSKGCLVSPDEARHVLWYSYMHADESGITLKNY
jgi:hypothetical protein